MRFVNHRAIAADAVEDAFDFYRCYENSISEIEDIDRSIGEIEVERATTGRARLRRAEMTELRRMRDSAINDRDFYGSTLAQVGVLIESIEVEDKVTRPHRY